MMSLVGDGVPRMSHSPKGTLGWKGQWDILVGHGIPEEIP